MVCLPTCRFCISGLLLFSCPVMSDSATLWTVAHQASLSMGFPRQEIHWNELPFPSPGDLPDPGIETVSLTSLALALAGRFFTTSATWEAPEQINQLISSLLGGWRIWELTLWVVTQAKKWWSQGFEPPLSDVWNQGCGYYIVPSSWAHGMASAWLQWVSD